MKSVVRVSQVWRVEHLGGSHGRGVCHRPQPRERSQSTGASSARCQWGNGSVPISLPQDFEPLFLSAFTAIRALPRGPSHRPRFDLRGTSTDSRTDAARSCLMLTTAAEIDGQNGRRAPGCAPAPPSAASQIQRQQPIPWAPWNPLILLVLPRFTATVPRGQERPPADPQQPRQPTETFTRQPDTGGSAAGGPRGRHTVAPPVRSGPLCHAA